ncbi:membrane-bound inhibitor of C-type lysozyme [Bartonella callosciuri]|uniref:Membrane-bound inhibitor of C-type lysozyme n=1 Tax=Bartonella callosciuri TaxID=686223 RepID=A0A840NRM1_9HYPH|nr:MliC family protein [Bartonella callosciuri]MBB5073711.1 membrane-bound inhibitor of C-type lysozyme [Bartonella callosciuri]
MKKTLHILGFLAASSLSLFSSDNALAGSLSFEVPDNPEPTTKIITYQCDTGISKERVEATYLKADNISLVDFKWQGDRVIAANVISSTGTKYAGANYIWWETNNEITLYDLAHDPEKKKPILCKDESILLF